MVVAEDIPTNEISEWHGIIQNKYKTTTQMEAYCEEGGLFFLGAQTEWLPAEHFMNIDNWDDLVKPSAAHYIKQAEEWIASKEKEGDELAQVGVILDMLHTMSNPMMNFVVNEEQEETVTPSIIVPKPTSTMEIGPDTIKRAKPFACNVCGKTLFSKQNLTQHLMIHSGEKPFACSQCGKGFAQKADMTKHFRVHSGEKPFPCSQCGKAFAQSSDLNKHLLVHSGEKPFSCSECGRAFARRITLTRHLRIHSGEKPFRCEKCGKSFTRSSYRNQHTKKCNLLI